MKIICLTLEHLWKSFFNAFVVGKFYLFMVLFILPFAFANPISWWQSYEI
jgi:hypothetical protein